MRQLEKKRWFLRFFLICFPLLVFEYQNCKCLQHDHESCRPAVVQIFTPQKWETGLALCFRLHLVGFFCLFLSVFLNDYYGKKESIIQMNKMSKNIIYNIVQGHGLTLQWGKAVTKTTFLFEIWVDTHWFQKEENERQAGKRAQQYGVKR